MPSLEVSVKGISIVIFVLSVTHTDTMTSPSTTLVLLDIVKWASEDMTLFHLDPLTEFGSMLAHGG